MVNKKVLFSFYLFVIVVVSASVLYIFDASKYFFLIFYSGLAFLLVMGGMIYYVLKDRKKPEVPSDFHTKVSEEEASRLAKNFLLSKGVALGEVSEEGIRMVGKEKDKTALFVLEFRENNSVNKYGLLINLEDTKMRLLLKNPSREQFEGAKFDIAKSQRDVKVVRRQWKDAMGEHEEVVEEPIVRYAEPEKKEVKEGELE